MEGLGPGACPPLLSPCAPGGCPRAGRAEPLTQTRPPEAAIAGERGEKQPGGESGGASPSTCGWAREGTKVSEGFSRAGPGPRCPRGVGSLLPPCSLGWGHGTQGQRPLGTAGRVIRRAEPPLAALETPPPALSCPLQRVHRPRPPSAPAPAPAQLPGPGHPHRSLQIGEGTALPQDLQPRRAAFWRLQLETRCQAPLWAGCCPQAFTHRGSLGGPKAECTEGWRAMRGLLAVRRPQARPLMGQTACWAPRCVPSPCVPGTGSGHTWILTAAQEGGPSRATCPRSQMARGGPIPRGPVPWSWPPGPFCLWTAQSTAVRTRHGAQSSGHVQVAQAGRGGWPWPWRSHL